jgi:hypothetical protein
MTGGSEFGIFEPGTYFNDHDLEEGAAKPDHQSITTTMAFIDHVQHHIPAPPSSDRWVRAVLQAVALGQPRLSGQAVMPGIFGWRR